MASYNPNNLSPDELSCPICFEEYSTVLNSERVPKLLLCLHTFCLGCVRSLVKSNRSVQCSICRTEHTDVAPQELFENYVILEFVRKQQEESDAMFARQQSEMMAESDRLPASQHLREQVFADAEMARKFQLYYDEGGEDTIQMPDHVAPSHSVRMGNVVQPPEVLCMAPREQPACYEAIRLSSCKTRVFSVLDNQQQTASSSASTSPSTNATSSSTSTYTSSTSDSCSEDRCSSQASSSSRIEDEFVDSVESLEGGACYSGGIGIVPTPVSAPAATKSSTSTATVGCVVAIVATTSIRLTMANTATDVNASGSSCASVLSATLTNKSGFSCSTYEADEEEDDGYIINDDNDDDDNDDEEEDDGDDSDNGYTAGGSEMEDADDTDDNMHLLEAFLDDDDEVEESNGEQEDELFVNLDALEEASVDSEVQEQQSPLSNPDVHIVNDSNSSYDSEGSLTANNDLSSSVDASVRSGYAEQVNNESYLVIPETDDDDDTDQPSDESSRDIQGCLLPVNPITGKIIIPCTFDMAWLENSDTLSDISQSTITLDDTDD